MAIKNLDNKLIKKYQELASRPLKDEKEIKMVEVIMLKYKEPEVETECVKRIIENTDYPFKLTVYDNRVNEDRSNTSKIWNKLIKKSDCDYVCVLDSDAFVPACKPCWLTRMMETFDKKKNTWMVVPLVNRTSCKQQKAEEQLEYPAEPERLKDVYAAQCAIYKKEIFNRIGYFDEDFYLYGQDSEWGARLMRSPYNAFIRRDVLVDHKGSYSMNHKKETEDVDMPAERKYAHYQYFKKVNEYY